MSETQVVLDAIATEARTEAAAVVGSSRGGPKTAEGLEIASRNSLQHGLTGSGIHLPADLRDEVVHWTEVLTRRFRPVGDEALEQVEAAALAFAQYRGAIAEQTRYLVQRSHDAIVHWDDRRIAQAEQLAQGLRNRPGLVAASLRASYRGAEWLLNRWRTLRSALDKKGDWNEEEVALAMDLLGIDPIRRPYDPAGLTRATAESRRLIVDDQCRDLEARLNDGHAAIENQARQREIDGQGYLLDRTYLKLERYARDAYRRYEKQIGLLEAYRKSLPRALRDPVPSPRVPASPSPALRQLAAQLETLMAERTSKAEQPAPPAPAIQPESPVITPADGRDQGRELRADRAQPSAIVGARSLLNAQQRRILENALRDPSDRKPKARR